MMMWKHYCSSYSNVYILILILNSDNNILLQENVFENVF